MSQQNISNQATNGNKTQQCYEYSCFRIHLFGWLSLKLRQRAIDLVVALDIKD